jgi:hypothetical protein
MSRVVFLMDKIMRKFGLSGKKVLCRNFWNSLRNTSHYGEILKTGRTINLPF